MRAHAAGFAVVVAFAGVSLLFAGGGDDATKKDLDAFKGVWTVVSAEKDGKKFTEEQYQGVTVKCDGTNKVVVRKGDKVLFAGTMKIDPTKKPKTIDTVQDSDGESKGKTFSGIYEIKDDTFKICTADPGKDRPTEFSGKAGSGHFYRVYKRETK
jgi:uncharacterized protein (TIGR03067 family)